MSSDKKYFPVHGLMPYPIASAWHRVELTVSDAERVSRLISCLEILLRTLVSFLLPDYLRGPGHDAVEEGIKKLSRPGFGTWMELLRELLRYLSRRKQVVSFIPEAQSWFLTNSGRATNAAVLLDELIALRNKIVHDIPGLSAAHERTRAEKMQEMLYEVFRSLSWLPGYRLVRILSLTPTRRKTFVGKLQFFIGVQELNNPLDGEWDAFLLKEKLYLVNPDGESLLELSPFLEILPDGQTKQERCFLFKQLSQNLRKIILVNDASGLEIEGGVREETGEVAFSDWTAAREALNLCQGNTDYGRTLRFPFKGVEINTGDILDGRYQVRGRLGAGGMAVVYRVFDEVIKTEVALKLLESNLLMEPGLGERFHREAITMAQVNHENIVKVLYVGELEDGRPFYTLPILAGGNLRDVINEGGCSEELAEKWAVQSLSALIYLHQKGIIHRDVKPGNLLLDESNNIKLADFGISIRMNEPRRLTGTLERMGSVAYMSPEQLQNRDISPKTDIYSLALVLHEIITGKDVRGTPGENLRGKLGELIRRMGNMDPQKRPGANEALEFLKFVPPDDSPTRLHTEISPGTQLNLEKIEHIEQCIEEIGQICESGNDNPDRVIELFAKFVSESLSLLTSIQKQINRESENSSEYALLCSISHFSKKVEHHLSSVDRTTIGEVELKGVKAQLHKKIVLPTEELLHQIQNRQDVESSAVDSFFEGFIETEPEDMDNYKKFDWMEYILSVDELKRFEGVTALLGMRQGDFLEEFELLGTGKKEQILEALWQMVDIILLEGGKRSRSIFEAALKFPGNKSLTLRWKHLYTLFTRTGARCESPGIVRAQLKKYPEKDQRVFGRALLIHPWPPYRELAMEMLDLSDFWHVIAHPRTPVAWLLSIWRYIKGTATPNYTKIFFVCVRDNLLTPKDVQKIRLAIEMIKEFYTVNAFYEDIYFNMLISMDDPIRREGLRHGFRVDMDREYVELFKAFRSAVPNPTQQVTGWSRIPLPVQRRLARRGYFLKFFVCHPKDPIALECLKHLLLRENVVEFVRIPSINSRLLHELGKEQNLFREDQARFALVANPKTQANIVLNHIRFLKSHHLRKLAQAREYNQVARDIAIKLLSRQK